MEKVNILFAGDWCVRDSATANINGDNIEKTSAPVKALTSKYDISVVNVETVFSDSPSPVKKSGPPLITPTSGLEWLGSMGFTVGAFANNHVCDQGEENGIKSIQAVKDLGMHTLGCGRNLEEATKPARLEAKGRKISILNYAEDEFTAATEDSFGFSPIDTYNNLCDIRREKAVSDYVFVYLHAGNELCPFPRDGVKKLCRTYIDGGADGVIISHPHTPQGMEYYNDKPICYSTGNFFMSKNTEVRSLWNIGYVVDIEISPDGKISATPVPYEFSSGCESFELLEGEKKESFLSYLKVLSDFIRDTEPLEYKKYEYAWSILYIEDCYNGFLQEFFKDTKTPDGEFMLFVKNTYACQSHTEVMKNFFTIYTKNRLGEFDEYKNKIRELQRLPF